MFGFLWGFFVWIERRGGGQVAQILSGLGRFGVLVGMSQLRGLLVGGRDFCLTWEGGPREVNLDSLCFCFGNRG